MPQHATLSHSNYHLIDIQAMEAVKFFPGAKKAEFVRVPIPKITQNNEVLVKVAYSGLCGTDLHIIQGEFPCEEIILGHEFSGIVVDFGTEVKHLSKGDLVVVDPNNGCRRCTFCHSKQPHFCSSRGRYGYIGTKDDGGFTEFCICAVEQVHKLPQGISLKTAALTEPLSCIAHGWDLISPVTVGQDILVMGGGIIGVLWACLFHFQGHKRITVAEINPSRLSLLRGLFSDLKLVVPEELGKTQFDVVVDTTGACPAIELGFSLLRSGGKFCVFGVAPPGAKIRISPFDIYMKELTVVGVKVNPFSFPKAIGLIEAMGESYLDFDKLGIKIFKHEDFFEALDQLKGGSITKAMFQYC